MNNSRITLEPTPNEPRRNTALIEREAHLVRVIEAIQEVQSSPAWSTLKTELFDGLVATLERQLRDEAKQEKPDDLKLTRLAGQLKWAEKYADLSKLEQAFRTELQAIRKNING